MKFTNLVAPQIRTLAQEFLASRSVQSVYDDLLSEITRTVEPVFDGDKRLSGPGLVKLMADVDAKMKARLVVIRAEMTVAPPTRARPKGEIHEARYVIVQAREPGKFRLMSVRFMATRKSFIVENRPLPIGFTSHAAERYLQRREDKDAAFKDIGKALLDVAVLAKIAQEFSVKHLGSNFLLPAEAMGGVLLGEFNRSVGCNAGLKIDRYKTDVIQDVKSFWPTKVCFNVMTFVDDDLLGIDQMRIAADLAEWIDSRRKEYDSITRSFCWPEHLILREDDIGDVAPIIDEMEKEVAAILCGPGVRKTIHRKCKGTETVLQSAAQAGADFALLDHGVTAALSGHLNVNKSGTDYAQTLMP